MKIFLVLVFCALSVLAAPPGQVEEKSPAITLREYWASNKGLEDRIINGSPAASGQFPWQCSNIFTVGASNFICGSSLIHPTAVLTAAHCVEGASLFQIGCGSLLLSNADGNRVTRTTSVGTAHPGYNSTTLNNDVGVVVWAQPIISTGLVQPVRLATAAESVGVAVSVTTSGWGRISDASQAVSQTLNYVNLSTISNAQCAGVYGTSVVVPSTLCTVGTGPQGNVGSTCNGDSGGPLGLLVGNEFVQHGVTSFVHVAGCGSGNPAGFVRVQLMREWINSQVPV